MSNEAILFMSLFTFFFVLIIVGSWFSRRMEAQEEAIANGQVIQQSQHQAQHLQTTTQPKSTQRTHATTQPKPQTVVLPPTPRPAPSLQPAPPQPVLLSFDKTWYILMKAVHVLIVGETNAGKSTAANALLAGRAETDMICVIDPHAEPGDWAGVPAIGAGRNYAEIDQALTTLLAQMADRYTRRAQGDKAYPALTIFVDELPAIMQHCKSARQFFGELVREARKVNMRLVALTQSTRVKTLGIEGEADVLENLTWLLLGEKALSVCADAAYLDWPAAIEKGGKIRAAYTTAFAGLALARIHPESIWKLSTISEPVTAEDVPTTFDLDQELARFVNGSATMVRPIGASSQGEKCAEPSEPSEPNRAEPRRTIITPPPANVINMPVEAQESFTTIGIEADAIRALIMQGWTATKIYELLKGTKQRRLAQIRAVKEAMEIELVSDSHEPLANAA
jgi:hypothetical protein